MGGAFARPPIPPTNADIADVAGIADIADIADVTGHFAHARSMGLLYNILNLYHFKILMAAHTHEKHARAHKIKFMYIKMKIVKSTLQNLEKLHFFVKIFAHVEKK